MDYPIGISAREGIASDATPILEDDRYTSGIVFARERGVPNVATLIATPQDDTKIFGGHIAGAYGSHVIEELYRNVGGLGARYYGVRVVGAGSVAATGTLGMNTGTNAATITTENIINPAPGMYAMRYYFFNNVHVGDKFTINGVDFTATEATPENVVQGLGLALGANLATTNEYWVSWFGNVIALQEQTANTAIAAVTNVTPIAGAAVTIFDASAGRRGQLDPGDWGNNLSLTIYPYGVQMPNSIVLDIMLKGERVEQWNAGSMGDLIALVNANSDYIVLSNYASGAAPTATLNLVLAGGVYVAPSAENEFYPVAGQKSFGALDGLTFSMMAQTEFFTNTIAAVGRDYANANRKIYLGWLPYLAASSIADTFASTLQTRSVLSRSIAVYEDWDEVSDGNGGWKFIPAIGRILGAGYIRIPQMNNDQIWFPPAGFDSVGSGFRSVVPTSLSQATIDEYVKNKTINVCKTQSGRGTYIASSRTMSTHPFFESIHISRLTNWLLNTLELSFEKTLQKPNTPELRATSIAEITNLFKSLYDGGALEKTIPFEKAFKVVCDNSNNPPGGNRKQLVVDVYWIPTECVEAMRINLNRNDGTLVASLMDVAAAA